MNIVPSHVQDFMKLYEDEFGESLTEDVAEIMMGECLQLFAMLAEPLPSERMLPE